MFLVLIYFSNASFLSLITLNLYKSDFLILQEISCNLMLLPEYILIS